ncbi:ubiquinone/menaquinone biosynthesis methyltransferase [Luteitalea pratensis]|nr:ubiquinone/menaquinone biosynthesis methyltransferase [Luteitalea pratensis]
MPATPSMPQKPGRPPRGVLTQALATPAGKASYVRALFDEIAPRYDDITVWLSLGRDAGWKDVLVRMAAVTPGERALDLACGTGDIAARLRAAGADVTGLDLTHRMLRLAAGKPELAGMRWVCGDMLALPIPDASQHVVTAGYGLRNVPDLRQSLREIRRVLVPGGRFLSLDFTLPRQPLIRATYLAYLRVVGGVVGQWLHGDPDTYRYIPESLARYPGAGGVATLMREEGFTQVSWWPLLGGLMAVNVGQARRTPH